MELVQVKGAHVCSSQCAGIGEVPRRIMFVNQRSLVTLYIKMIEIQKGQEPSETQGQAPGLAVRRVMLRFEGPWGQISRNQMRSPLADKSQKEGYLQKACLCAYGWHTIQ
eukprot:729302-Pelagomonas_calceolata.AAC.4